MVGSTDGENSRLVAVAIIDESIVAMAAETPSDGRVTIWSSADGLIWTEEPGARPELGSFSGEPDLAAAGPGLVAVGFGGFGEAATPLWVWRPPGS